jgi:hypothetical protein
VTTVSRDLLVVSRDGSVKVDGSVSLVDDESAAFSGFAVDVFGGLRRREGDVAAARLLLEAGWSNGQGSCYLADPVTT